MRIAVFGAGAVGGLLGALLSRAGHEVLLVAREEAVVAIRLDGLRLEGPHEGSYAVAATETIPEGLTTDALLVTVKAPDLARAGEEIARRLHPLPPILLLQNGLGIEEAFRSGWEAAGQGPPASSALRAVSTVPATWISPGQVREAGSGEILFGPGAAAAEAPTPLLRLLGSAGIAVREVPDLNREIWRKAILNAAINPVTADHEIPNGRLARAPWRGQAEALLQEAREVARAEGFDFPPEEIDADLWKVVRATARNRSSMLQDLERGRPTEIEFISGAILRIGAAHGLALPATERAVARIRAKAGPPGGSRAPGESA